MAVSQWPDFEGRMHREHVDIEAVLNEPLYVLVGVLISYLVDDLASFDRPRMLARRCLQHVLLHGRMPTDEELTKAPGAEDAPPDPETWGMDPQAIADNERALAMFGGG